MKKAQRALTMLLTLGALITSGCARRMPEVNLDKLDPGYLEACRTGPGTLVILDERTDAIWGHGYDKTKWLLLGEERGGDLGQAPTTTTTIHRRLIKILGAQGVPAVSKFQVVHYKKQLPPVEVKVWQSNGQVRPVNVRPIETIPLADWHCEHSWPRQTTFRIATLKAGDLVEIIKPLIGPDMLEWEFASSEHCVLTSRAQFGHPDDIYRLALQAHVTDRTGAARRTSPDETYPMVFEHHLPTPPMAADDLPRLRTSQRCNGWSHLRARAFNAVIWLARSGGLEDKPWGVHPHLLRPVEAGEKTRRARASSAWVAQHVDLERWAGPRWMRWTPRMKPASVLKRKAADAASASVLLFAILERAQFKPRFALVHTDIHSPFSLEQPDLAQFDRLAVVFDDETGKTHWLLPGLTYDPEDQPPRLLKGRWALMLERYWIERHQGSGPCQPEIEIPWSCQIATPEPVELRLVEIGAGPKAAKE